MTALEVLTRFNLEKSFWGRRIIKAEKSGSFTKKDIAQASNWVTCACGKSNYSVERYDNKIPIDFKLGKLGEEFATVLNSTPQYLGDPPQQYLDATNILIDIKRRAKSISVKSK